MKPQKEQLGPEVLEKVVERRVGGGGKHPRNMTGGFSCKRIAGKHQVGAVQEVLEDAKAMRQ